MAVLARPRQLLHALLYLLRPWSRVLHGTSTSDRQGRRECDRSIAQEVLDETP